ncbi:MAG: divergent polysaccharide deacetylase family protein [Geobacteraceae bacterium]
MAKGRKGAYRNRRKKSGNRSLLLLISIGVVIALAFFLLERVRKSSFVHVPERPAQEERQKMPYRTTSPNAVLEGYSAPVTLPSEVKPAAKKRATGPGAVAIIVDDMGSSIREINAILAIDMPITISIIPGLARGKEVAALAHRDGREVMLHIPMEPKGYENKPFEKNGLLLAMSDAEIERHLGVYLQSVPFVVGANNHMGSRFTEDNAKMRSVLNVLKSRGLFFVDSKTSPASVGDRLAREMGINTAARSVFLDNVQDVAAINAQLEQLAAVARKRGSAIGICHPHKTSLQVLAAELPELKREGINFVYASQLVR